MRRSLASRLDAVKVKPLDMSLRPASAATSTELTSEQIAGRMLERLLHEAAISKKALSIDLEQDKSIVSGYVDGTRLPKLAVWLLTNQDIRRPLVKVLLDIKGDGMWREEVVHMEPEQKEEAAS